MHSAESHHDRLQIQENDGTCVWDKVALPWVVPTAAGMRFTGETHLRSTTVANRSAGEQLASQLELPGCMLRRLGGAAGGGLFHVALGSAGGVDTDVLAVTVADRA